MTGKDECSLEFCDKPEHARGVCQGHYGQWRRGKPFTPLQERNRVTARGKKCTRCGEFKPKSAFYQKPRMSTRCIACLMSLTHERTQARREATEALRASRRIDVGQYPRTINEAVREASDG